MRTTLFVTAALLLTTCSNFRLPDFTVIVRPTNVVVYTDFKKGSIITWTGFEVAEFYELQMRSKTKGRTKFTHWLTTNSALIETTHNHKYTHPGTTYQYRIRALGRNRNPVGGWSEPVTYYGPPGPLPNTPPSDPTPDPTTTPTPAPVPDSESPGGPDSPPPDIDGPTPRPPPPTPVIDG